MHRLVVALLAALDAVLAAVVGVAAALAPLALLWLFGGTFPWNALWPTAVSVWQLGHLVPLHIHLPAEYLAVAGIDQGAASFVISLAPLAFASFTAIFAARSGVRAARADAPATGPVAGILVFALLAAIVGLTGRNPVAAIHLWQGVLFPAAVYAVGVVLGALVAGWQEADPTGDRILDRARGHVDHARRGWDHAIDAIARGTGITVAGLVGLGAFAVALAVIFRAGSIIALFEAGHVDLLGAIVVTLGQLAYLPTLVVWGMSFVAGPGFAFGTDTTVSPAGTQLAVVPGIPLLGALPETTSAWLLVLVLLPVGLGAFAGWAARARLAEHEHAGAGLRAVVAAGIAVLSAGAAALLALAASGSLGPGRLAEVGPQPGPVAFAVGLEVLLGAGILLLSPARETFESADAEEDWEKRFELDAAAPAAPPSPRFDSLRSLNDPQGVDADENETAPIDPLPSSVSTPDDDETAPIEPLPEEPKKPKTPKPPPPAASRPDLGPNRPNPLPPID
ncbi:DUF6350 family protein [Microbacterium sp. ASV49]|uniref:DUF6350 family protein n=1 Tax=Microbacterium candidum TaxID=3041922 RepID=A0ABT7MX52_9MICO|nr:DUF6350 family protein [Microbacterium sp. ASV49]MDL9979005.1 DUF6350 family protein [Microbacterium sp. ASV49]